MLPRPHVRNGTNLNYSQGRMVTRRRNRKGKGKGKGRRPCKAIFSRPLRLSRSGTTLRRLRYLPAHGMPTSSSLRFRLRQRHRQDRKCPGRIRSQVLLTISQTPRAPTQVLRTNALVSQARTQNRRASRADGMCVGLCPATTQALHMCHGRNMIRPVQNVQSWKGPISRLRCQMRLPVRV